MARKKNTKQSGSWRSTVLWSLVTVGILTVLWFSVQRKAQSGITNVKIDVVDLKDKKNLLTQKHILTMCRKHLGYDLKAGTIENIDTRNLETKLNADPRIKKSEVYIDAKNVIHIDVEQRQPIVRVQGDVAYYLDNEGGRIPLAKGSTLRVPIATGAIEKYDAGKINGKKQSNLKDVYTMAKFIHDDNFLSSLIEQIDIDKNGEILLVPKIGKQELVFGKAQEIEDRFENLKIFYKGGMSKVGWRKFDRLVLNWKGQVLGQRDVD